MINIASTLVIVKGGITSSYLAIHGLDKLCTEVLGQILPGVSVWQTAAEPHWPSLVYEFYPGNIGGPRALAETVRVLRGWEYGSIERECPTVA